jgi:hypothetical protein
MRIQRLTRPHLFAMTNGCERDQYLRCDSALTAYERKNENDIPGFYATRVEGSPAAFVV